MNFIFEKFAEHFAHWKKKTYPKLIIKSMRYAGFINKQILTTTQIKKELQACANNWQIYFEKNKKGIKNCRDLLDKIVTELKS